MVRDMGRGARARGGSVNGLNDYPYSSEILYLMECGFWTPRVATVNLFPLFPHTHRFWTNYVSTIATVQVEVSTQVRQLETSIIPLSPWAI